MSYEDDEDDDRYISERDARPQQHNGGEASGGHTQSFQCPSCGSWNTAQATYVDWCKSCGWSQGY